MEKVRRAVNMVKVQCLTCGLVSTRGGMGMHLKASLHQGRKELTS